MALSGPRRYVYILLFFLLIGFTSIFGSWKATSQAFREFETRLQPLVNSVLQEAGSRSQQFRFVEFPEIKSNNTSQSTFLLVNQNSENVPSEVVENQVAAVSAIDGSTPPQSSTAELNSSLLTDEDLSKFASKSSLDFVAFFGAGHRLNRMSMAHYVAQHLGIGFRTFWGVCLHTEIFKYLFGPKPLRDLTKVESEDQFILFVNIVEPGPENLQRFGNDSSSKDCMCSTRPALEKVQADVTLYRTMRDRFRARDKIEAFRQEHFANASLVIGMHIRAGNGEKEHFEASNRIIQNADEWKRHVAEHVQSLATTWRRDAKAKEKDPSYKLRPVTLFIATDTPSMIQSFQNALQNDTIQVVEWSQERREDGGGVLFGAQASHQKGSKCLPGWEATLADMILLSYADIVVAPRSSTFTQTLPMSLAYAARQDRLDTLGGQPNSNELPPAFCEMNPTATEMQCFNTFIDWCCKGSTTFVGREHLEVPDRNFSNFVYQMLPRRKDTSTCIGKRYGTRFEVNCLPFDYSHKGW